jgi:SPP1 family predicted phage head-tail adaptor
MTRAGTLRDRATFQRPVPGDDGYGGVITSWADYITVWADIRETVGKERVEAGRIEAASTATVRVHASTQSRALTEADRMVARGWTWNIRSIVPVGNDRAMIDLLVERGVAA